MLPAIPGLMEEEPFAVEPGALVGDTRAIQARRAEVGGARKLAAEHQLPEGHFLFWFS